MLAIYLGKNSSILYDSKYYYEIRELDFEAFKVAVTPDTWMEKMDRKSLLKEPDRKAIKEIKYIKIWCRKRKKF